PPLCLVHVCGVGPQYAARHAAARDAVLRVDDYRVGTLIVEHQLLGVVPGRDRAAARENDRDDRPGGDAATSQASRSLHQTAPARMRSCRCTMPSSTRSPDTTGIAMMPCASISNTAADA